VVARDARRRRADVVLVGPEADLLVEAVGAELGGVLSAVGPLVQIAQELDGRAIAEP
jgi:hypothetical protein